MASTRNYLNTRSITLPVRSHPTTQRIEQELNKLKPYEASLSSPSATTIRNALLGLQDLYKCIEDLLGLPLTRLALAQHQQEQWVQQLLDDSLKYVDFCGNARDTILVFKQNVKELQSSIRRRKVTISSIESNVIAYTCFRRNMKKEIGHCLKQLVNKQGFIPLNLNSHLCAVVRVLRESSLITSSVFGSLSLFLSTHVVKAKPRKWSLVSMMVHKGVFLGSYEEKTQQNNKGINEFESVDIALGELLMMMQVSSDCNIEVEKIECAQRKLEALISVIEEIEHRLECLFRLLIHNRVCLLNVLSQ